MYYIFLFFLLMTGCSVDADKFGDSSKPIVSEISATYSENGTKTCIDGLNVSWSEADAIGVYDALNTSSSFTIASGSGTKNATFTGTFAGGGRRTVYAVYPYSAGTVAADNKTYTFALPPVQVQNGSADAIGYGRYGYMVSAPIEADPASAGVSLSFDHIMTYLSFEFYGLGEDDKILSVELKAGSKVLPASVASDISVSQHEFSTVTTTDHIVTYVSNATTSLRTVNISMFPINSDVSKTVFVKISNNGAIRLLKKEVGNLKYSDTEGFAAGKRYIIRANLGNATAVGLDESWDIWTGTTPDAVPDTYIVDEVTGNITIAGADALAWFSARVSSGSSFSGKTVSLGANIDLSSTNWPVIGSSSYPFTGVFDGAGYKIRNLLSSNTSYAGSSVVSGLFGYVAGGAVIKNVVLESGYVYGKTATVSYAGNAYCGGICAISQGDVTFSNCYNGADVYGVTTSNSASATPCVGGILGYVKPLSSTSVTISFISCVNDGKIQGDGGYGVYVGGIAGRLQHELNFTDCVNNGDISAYQQCNSFTTSIPSVGVCIGGIAGGANTTAGTGGNSSYSANYTFTSCISNGKLTGRVATAHAVKRLGGICGGGDYYSGVYNETICVNNVPSDSDPEADPVDLALLKTSLASCQSSSNYVKRLSLSDNNYTFTLNRNLEYKISKNQMTLIEAPSVSSKDEAALIALLPNNYRTTGKVYAVSSDRDYHFYFPDGTLQILGNDANILYNPSLPYIGNSGTLNVMSIGNSLMNDTGWHIPGILKNLGIESQVNFTMCYHGGQILPNHDINFNVDNWVCTEVFEGDYIEENDGGWLSMYSSPYDKNISTTMDVRDWDVVIIQEWTGHSAAWNWTSTEKNAVLSLVNKIYDKQPEHRPTIVYLVSHVYGNVFYKEGAFYNVLWDYFDGDQVKMYNKVMERVPLILNETPIDYYFSNATSVQNLRTTRLRNAHPLDLSRDCVHSDMGITRFCEACTLFEAVFAPCLGRSISELTYTFDQSNNTPGYYKTPVTDDNRPLAVAAAQAAVEHPLVITDLSDAHGDGTLEDLNNGGSENW